MKEKPWRPGEKPAGERMVMTADDGSTICCECGAEFDNTEVGTAALWTHACQGER